MREEETERDISDEEGDVSSPDQNTSKDSFSDPTYVEPELANKVVVPLSADTDRLVYDDIHGFQNKEVIEPDHTAEQACETGIDY